MSYHARIRTPPLIVTGRTGAWGKTQRTDGDAGRRSSGTSDSKSCPSAPSPCISRTAASAAARGSTSTVSRRSPLTPGERPPRRLQLLLEHLGDARLGHGADLLLRDLPALEDEEGRDRADPEGLGDGRVLVHVQLADLGPAGVRGGQRVDRGGDHAARGAPLGPEVHEHGSLRLRDFLLPVVVRQNHHVLVHESHSSGKGRFGAASLHRLDPEWAGTLHDPVGRAEVLSRSDFRPVDGQGILRTRDDTLGPHT